MTNQTESTRQSLQRGNRGRTKLAVALDVPGQEQALELARRLAGHVGLFKVGLELFAAAGPTLIKKLVDMDYEIFLDLKLHDIPATVRRAAQRVGDLHVSYLTVHTGDGPTIVQACVEGASHHPELKVLGVTVLTSLDQKELSRVGIERPIEELVRLRAESAIRAGCHGLVCSPKEVQMLRTQHPDTTLVVPGIRPAWGEAKRDDQARVATPAQATAWGANVLVVGRPIRDADDPAGAADRITEEISSVFNEIR